MSKPGASRPDTLLVRFAKHEMVKLKLASAAIDIPMSHLVRKCVNRSLGGLLREEAGDVRAAIGEVLKELDRLDPDSVA